MPLLDTSDAVVKALVDAAQVSGASTNGFLAGMKGCKVARVVVGEPGRRQSSGSGGCSVSRKRDHWISAEVLIYQYFN